MKSVCREESRNYKYSEDRFKNLWIIAIILESVLLQPRDCPDEA